MLIRIIIRLDVSTITIFVVKVEFNLLQRNLKTVSSVFAPLEWLTRSSGMCRPARRHSRSCLWHLFLTPTCPHFFFSFSYSLVSLSCLSHGCQRLTSVFLRALLSHPNTGGGRRYDSYVVRCFVSRSFKVLNSLGAAATFNACDRYCCNYVLSHIGH